MSWIRREAKHLVVISLSFSLHMAGMLVRTMLGATGAIVFLAWSVAAQSNHTPSSHCHVTDGTFSTCPDGSQEWSDVPVQSFPDTNSFLYADQANLDPTR